MLHVAEAPYGERFPGPDGAVPADPAHVVPAQIDEHGVLGPLLFVGEQLRGQPSVLPLVPGDRARAGDGERLDRGAGDAHQHLGRGAHRAPPPVPDVVHVRRRVSRRSRSTAPARRPPRRTKTCATGQPGRRRRRARTLWPFGPSLCSGRGPPRPRPRRPRTCRSRALGGACPICPRRSGNKTPCPARCRRARRRRIYAELEERARLAVRIGYVLEQADRAVAHRAHRAPQVPVRAVRAAAQHLFELAERIGAVLPCATAAPLGYFQPSGVPADERGRIEAHHRGLCQLAGAGQRFEQERVRATARRGAVRLELVAPRLKRHEARCPVSKGVHPWPGAAAFIFKPWIAAPARGALQMLITVCPGRGAWQLRRPQSGSRGSARCAKSARARPRCRPRYGTWA